jgi:transcriptional regulator with XRE-family HTH domain
VIKGGTVGERVRYLRQRRVMTIRELAERAGIAHWQTVQAIETGKHRPRPSTLRKLAAALEVEPAALLPENGDAA